MITKIDVAELQRMTREVPPLTLIDVLPEEVLKAQHLPGARNACDYEVTFLDQVKRIGVRPTDRLVVYGSGSGSIDSPTVRVQPGLRFQRWTNSLGRCRRQVRRYGKAPN